MTKRRIIIALWIAGIVASCLVAVVILAYPAMEAQYQRDIDRVRKQHALEMGVIIMDFIQKTGKPPFQDEAKEKPVLVIIGRTPEQEKGYESEPTISRDAIYKRSSELESLLSKELGRNIELPREPQKVPTFAPNVYIYFVTDTQFSVAVHLANPTPNAVAYPWGRGKYYSYTVSYGKLP